MKIRCIKSDCEVCGISSTIQVFFKSNGQIGYGRSRHYLGKLDGKPQFEYHTQTTAYLEKRLVELGITYDTVSHDQQINSKNNGDSLKQNSSSKTSSKVFVEPSAGFGPATITLPR